VVSDIKKLSEQIVKAGERLGNVADAVEGKDSERTLPRARWLLLPAAGAGIYAFVTSGAFTRQARDTVKDARDRASDLPDDLARLLNEATTSSSERRQTPRRGKTGQSRANTRKASRK
jgi:hypothetical protein